jgi:hypothetical protein
VRSALDDPPPVYRSSTVPIPIEDAVGQFLAPSESTTGDKSDLQEKQGRRCGHERYSCFKGKPPGEAASRPPPV